MRIWTIGHSTRTWEEFLELLRRFDVGTIADVRSYPGSRRYPHFNQQDMKDALARAGLFYCHWPGLGGRRKPNVNSTNTIWRNEAFRGYADYMETPTFQNALEDFVSHSDDHTALMCSEAVWWRCHRSLISDALKAAGHEVFHIGTSKKAELHPYTEPARLDHGKLIYGPRELHFPRARAPEPLPLTQ